MPGRGRAPRDPAQRINTNALRRGEIQVAEVGSVGSMGRGPAHRAGLLPASEEAWNIWMGAWFASFWTPSDVPGLQVLVRLYDEALRGRFQRAGELRLWSDSYGATPKGAQDRRWRPPVEGDAAPSKARGDSLPPPSGRGRAAAGRGWGGRWLTGGGGGGARGGTVGPQTVMADSGWPAPGCLHRLLSSLVRTATT